MIQGFKETEGILFKVGVHLSAVGTNCRYGEATAWTMLHRFRTAMVRPDRDRLSGEVEVDETLLGGEEHGGKRGCGAGRESLVAVAVEVLSPKDFVRVRMRRVPDASGGELGAIRL
jgi:hypothetical protein